MLLVAMPTDFVALGIALRAAVTIRGNLGHHLRQSLLTLPLDGRLLGGSAFSPRRGRPRLFAGAGVTGAAALSWVESWSDGDSGTSAVSAFPASDAHELRWRCHPG